VAPEDFSVVARLMRRRAGISLSLAKLEHVERRLMPVLRLFDLRDMDGLVRQLRLGHEALAGAVTEALTVNESSFFRDPEVFEKLRLSVLPRLMRARPGRRLKIWSAAAAGGQEAYSIAILLSEMGLAAHGWTVEIIATDLSAQAVARAEEGWYSADEIGRGLAPARRDAWFRAEGKNWRIRETLRRMVRFRRFNLLDSYGWLDELDIVLCRNVLMYFDRAARASVLERMLDAMAPDGVLVLGKTESTAQGGLVPTPEGFYTPKPQTRARLTA
jgi:chemotaxis protein methyltransferase CheR